MLDGYGIPASDAAFPYPNIGDALGATDASARDAMYGPQGTLDRDRADFSNQTRNALSDYLAGARAMQPQSASDLAYYVPGVGNALSARDAYNSAREGDWRGSMLSGIGAAPLGAGIFAGQSARTADLVKLARAAQMEKAGHAPEAILGDTGWFRGAEGRWKFEIPDNGLQLRMGGGPPVKNGQDYAFDSFVHPELRAAYGDLVNSVQGSYGKSFPYIQGAYYPNSRAIDAMGPDFMRAKMALAHELQHAVQQREGFAKGANPASIPAEEIAAEREALLDRLEKDGSFLSRMPTDAEIAHNLYAHHAGEVESRNVENRLYYPADVRAMKPPWETQDVPYDQQIIKRNY